MSFCSFSDKYLTMGVTPVENLFIQTYLPQAPGDYVRVYLYGLMQCYYAVGETNLAGMAHQLDLPEETVMAAFQYWERQGLVERMQDNPPTFRYLNPVSAMMNGGGRLDEQIYKYQDLNNQIQKLIPDRPFRPADSEMVCQWVEDLGMPQEVVLIFVKHCIDSYLNRRGSRKPQGLKNFFLKNYDKEALQWASEGILTVEQAEQRAERDKAYYRLSQKVLDQFSLNRAPTREELNLAKKWLLQWGLTEEAVLSAMRETTKSRNPSFAYLDAILESNQQARTAQAMDEQLAEKDRVRASLKAVYEAMNFKDRAPSAGDVENYRRYLSGGFTEGAILRVARELGSRGQFDMERLDRALTGFAGRGQFTEADVEAYLSHQRTLRDQAAQVFALCGMADRKITNADARQLETWLSQYPLPLIEYAAQCAYGTQLPPKYMETTLKKWKQEGITDADAAKARHPLPRKKEGGAAKPSALAAQDYSQRAYTGDMINLFEDDEEGDKP